MKLRSVACATVASAVLLCGGLEAHADRPTTAGAPVVAVVTPDTVRADAVTRSRAIKHDATAKVLAALQTDPRFGPLQKELAEAAKISDVALQREKLKEIAVRAQAPRAEAIRKAGIDVVKLDAAVLDARTPPPPTLPKPFHPPALPGAGAAPPAPPTTATVTSFTEIDTRKLECPDAGDTWTFTGISSHDDISSAPFDHDCGWIRAAKGGFVVVPAGTKHVAFTVKLDFSLKTIASSIGIYATASAEVGVRIENMNGTPIDVIKVAGAPPIPTPVSFCWMKRVSSTQGPDFVPYSDSGDQGLNTTVSCAFDVDPKGGPMIVAPYVGGSVDADLTGYARSFGTVTPHSVVATFSK
jgi:hypothetical protein